MYVYKCRYLYIYIHMYISIYIYIYMYIHIYISIDKHACAQKDPYVRIHTDIYI